MEKPDSYCEYVSNLPSNNIHRVYHDNQYGFPIDSDNEMFGRLILEINQAGLSWITILNKQENFRKAYSNFDVKIVANFSDADFKRLIQDSQIIRNKLKINAVIHNANKIVELQKSYGSFKNWLDHNHPLSLDMWVKLFKKTFKFTGREITKEFLISLGYLPGAHIKACVTFNVVSKLNPMWKIISK